MLARVVERVMAAKTIDEVVIATTVHPRDEAIVALANAQGWSCVRGSEDDVLDRYYQAATAYGAEVIVRVCSDCPLTDPAVLDALVTLLVSGNGYDYVANNFAPATYPKGLDAEAFTMSALSAAWSHDKRPDWREHVTPFIRQHPETFRHGALSTDTPRPELRWTVDVPEDLALMQRIYGALEPTSHWRDVVRLLDENPGWLALNAHVTQRVVAPRESGSTRGGEL
jgi:spore coat polysaccharide biosynthesis protein SpsF